MRLVIIVSLALLAAGCATAFHGSAPLGNGQELVVGSREGAPTVWVCTIANASQECQRVEVVQ